MEFQLPMVLRAASILTAGRLSWRSRWLHPGREFSRTCPLLMPRVRSGIRTLGGPILSCCYLPRGMAFPLLFLPVPLVPGVPVRADCGHSLVLLCPFGCDGPHSTLNNETLVSASESPLPARAPSRN